MNPSNMKTLFKHIISSVIGSGSIFLALSVESYFWGIRNSVNENKMMEFDKFAFSDFLLFVMLLIIILIVQISVVLPTFSILKRKGLLNNKTISILGLLLSIILGFIFGRIFSVSDLGIKDVMTTYLVGFCIFLIQYFINFLTYIKLDRVKNTVGNNV
jgi:hypothetical protein